VATGAMAAGGAGRGPLCEERDDEAVAVLRGAARPRPMARDGHAHPELDEGPVRPDRLPAPEGADGSRGHAAHEDDDGAPPHATAPCQPAHSRQSSHASHASLARAVHIWL